MPVSTSKQRVDRLAEALRHWQVVDVRVEAQRCRLAAWPRGGRSVLVVWHPAT